MTINVGLPAEAPQVTFDEGQDTMHESLPDYRRIDERRLSRGDASCKASRNWRPV